MQIDDDNIVPFRRTRAVRSISQTVQVDIEIDLIRQCREDWRRGETEIWRHLTQEADLRRDAEGHLRLYGLPDHEEGVLVPAPAAAAVTSFEQPGLCVALASDAIRSAEASLQPATVLTPSFRRAG